MCTEPDAQTHRHQIHPDHRRRPDRHRPGLRVRLFRHPGLQGAEGRGLPDRPGQLQSGDDHDRSGSRRRHLHRADHAGDRRQDHREGAARTRCCRPWAGRPRSTRALSLQQDGRARQVRRRDDRRHRRGHRQGRGPRAVPRGDEEDRPRDAALASRQDARSDALEGARRHRPARDHPPVASRSAAPAAASPTTREEFIEIVEARPRCLARPTRC